jgi:cell division septum initiation protein DivIVA
MTAHQDVAGLVSRLRFDADRCDIQFSKGVATNITEAADRLESLSQALREAEKERDRVKTDCAVTSNSYLSRATAAESRLAEATKVIGFYAEQKNWESPSSGFALQYDPTPSKIQTDWGEAARAFIAGNGGKDE